MGAVELDVVNVDPALAGPTTPTSSGIDLKSENGKENSMWKYSWADCSHCNRMAGNRRQRKSCGRMSHSSVGRLFNAADFEIGSELGKAAATFAGTELVDPACLNIPGKD